MSGTSGEGRGVSAVIGAPSPFDGAARGPFEAIGEWRIRTGQQGSSKVELRSSGCALCSLLSPALLLHRSQGLGTDLSLALGVEERAFLALLFGGGLFGAKLEVALIAAGVQRTGFDGGFDGAPGLAIVRTI